MIVCPHCGAEFTPLPKKPGPLKKEGYHGQYEDEVDWIVQAHLESKPIHDIAKALRRLYPHGHITQSTICYILKRCGHKATSSFRLVTKERNQEIIALRESGKTFTEIGEQFGISRNRVREIWLRNEWKKQKPSPDNPEEETPRERNYRMLDNYGFSARTRNCIWNAWGEGWWPAEIAPEEPTPENIANKLTAREWLEFPNFGLRSLAELEAFLAKHGLKLKEDKND